MAPPTPPTLPAVAAINLLPTAANTLHQTQPSQSLGTQPSNVSDSFSESRTVENQNEGPREDKQHWVPLAPIDQILAHHHRPPPTHPSPNAGCILVSRPPPAASRPSILFLFIVTGHEMLFLFFFSFVLTQAERVSHLSGQQGKGIQECRKAQSEECCPHMLFLE